MKRQDYLGLLEHPGRKSRVKTRWWWYGCKVKENEIIYQLDEMQRAGIGGVEIQITYPLQSGNDNYEYFSPDYFRILQFTSEELKKRDMTLDLTLGSSWPYGGPFVPFVKSAISVIPLELSVEGPCTWEYDFTNRISGEIVGCVMGRMEGTAMLPETITDISGYLTDKLLYEWPWGIRLDQVPVPEGVWKIVVFVSGQFREHVLMPTRGAEGYVIDHNNKEAMRFFLEHAGTPLAEKLGRGSVDNFFCDSLEVFGHNWTIGLYEEFEKRRGYSLKPYIYALWGEVKGLTDKIRYDFHRTLSELTVEGFFREMTKWCHEVGSKSRIQAHGTWGDVLLAYAAADIPEGETFSAWDKFSVNTVHRRLASSAGHLYHRPVISNESFTWLRFPRFTETLEQIKIAADSIFVDGINQIVNHGYSYSPAPGKNASDAAAGGPSLPDGSEPLFFYASSTISHTNTWWNYYPQVSRYMHRVCEFLQMGDPAADLCIYLPQNDIWAENPLSDVHMCMKLEEKLETAAVDALAHRGYWFDYINDDALTRWQEYSYRVLIIMETDRMPESSVRAVRAFAKAGGLVICAGKMPSLDCGMNGSYDVRSAFEEMARDGLVQVTANKRYALTDFLEKHVTPDLCITEGRGDIGYVHRRIRRKETDPAADPKSGRITGEIYFAANMSLCPHLTTLRFSKGAGVPLILDPMTGCEVQTAKVRINQDREKPYAAEADLYFPEGQSYLIIFDEECEGSPKETGQMRRVNDTLSFLEKRELRKEKVPGPEKKETGGFHSGWKVRDISGGWDLCVPDRNFSVRTSVLKGFENIPELRYYSGEAVYTRSVFLSKEELSSERVFLTAEEIGCAAKITVNGSVLGEWIMRPWVMDIRPALHEGDNVLEIRVSNLLINRFLDPGWKLKEYPDRIMEEWPYFPQQLIKERGKRLSNWREKEMVKEPYPSGLIGKVQLVIAKLCDS